MLTMLQIGPLMILCPPAKPETLGQSTAGPLWQDCKRVFNAVLRMAPLPVVERWDASTNAVLAFTHVFAGEPLAVTLAQFLESRKHRWLRLVPIYCREEEEEP
jgi:hypothetical protein